MFLSERLGALVTLERFHTASTSIVNSFQMQAHVAFLRERPVANVTLERLDVTNTVNVSLVHAQVVIRHERFATNVTHVLGVRTLKS